MRSALKYLCMKYICMKTALCSLIYRRKLSIGTLPLVSDNLVIPDMRVVLLQRQKSSVVLYLTKQIPGGWFFLLDKKGNK